MDRRTRSYLDRAAEAVAEGRFEDAATFERTAADHVRRLGDPLEERAALLDAGARRQYASGDAVRAADTLETLIGFRRRLGVDVADAQYRRGLALQAAGRHVPALECFDAVVAAGPPALIARSKAASAVSLRALGRPDEARLVAHPARGGTSPAAVVRDGAPDTLEAVRAELDALVGLREVKARIGDLADFQRVQAMRAQEGLKRAAVSQHLAFTGSPGTGKTTVARLYGRLLHALGVLATDKLVETSRAQLVAGYVGQTAAKVDAVVDSALDGVLFVDEAYSLTESGSDNDFGAEAVTQLLTRMENERDRLAVIFAGYSEPMARFLASNPGLESRVSEVVAFPDYDPAELAEIFARFCAQADYALTGAAEQRLLEALTALHAARDETFGNARTVRNLFEDAIVAQAGRLIEAGSSDLRALEPADIEAALKENACP